MIVAVPGILPETIPVVNPIDAVSVSLLVQIPLSVAELKDTVLPEQTVFVPVIAAGKAPTVNIIVLRHTAESA